MDDEPKSKNLAAIVLSRTLFLAMRITDEVSHQRSQPLPVSPEALAKYEPISIRLKENRAKEALCELIAEICRGNWIPDIICIGTYGAFVHPDKHLPRLGLEAISKEAIGPLAGEELRKTVEETLDSILGPESRPQIVIETDTGVYAVGENYVRSLPGFGSNPRLTKDDPVAFGFFSGGVGAAVCQNLIINRGLFVGQRGMMPMYPHPLDIKNGFEPKHPLKFSLAALTELQSIEHRAAILGYPETSFSKLATMEELEIWDIVAHYIAMFCIGMLAQHSPRVIVLGGMVVNDTPHLLGLIRATFSDLLGDLGKHYTNKMEIVSQPDTYIQAATSLDTCLYGCLQIAKSHLQSGEKIL